MVEEGVTAPGFSLPAAGGATLSLADFAGKWVVLYFYPKDNTPGCTTEAKDFSALLQEFAARNAVVIGASKDSVRKHDNFREKQGLSVELVSDETGELCEAYGVWVEKQLYGRTYMGIQRATFLIDPDGKVVKVWPKVKVKGHAEVVLGEIPVR